MVHTCANHTSWLPLAAVMHAHTTYHRPRYSPIQQIFQVVIVPPRATSRKIQLRGVFKGATVVRSSVDWEWEEQDGGKGSPGTVLDIQDWKGETARSIAQVRWAANGITNFYR